MRELWGRGYKLYELTNELVVSPSLLNLYEKCKYAVYHRLTHKWVQLPERITRGIDVHERLEKVVNGEVKPTFQEMQLLRFLNDLGHDFKTEQFIRLEINGIKYIGKYDVLINNGSIILDFKVPAKGLPYKLSKWYIESYQQIIYQRIIYELLGTKPIFILVFYDPEGVSKVFKWFELPFIGHSHWYKVESLARQLKEDYFYENFPATPEKRKCNMCIYKFTCPYAIS